jgi:hypothetical protein
VRSSNFHHKEATMLRKSPFILAAALALPLAACGTQPGERAATGGAIGAGTGAAVGAVAGDTTTGALLGGAAGAAAGALTEPDDVYLGEPFWR